MKKSTVTLRLLTFIFISSFQTIVRAETVGNSSSEVGDFRPQIRWTVVTIPVPRSGEAVFKQNPKISHGFSERDPSLLEMLHYEHQEVVALPFFERINLCRRVRGSLIPHVNVEMGDRWVGLASVPYFCIENKGVATLNAIPLGKNMFLFYASIRF